MSNSWRDWGKSLGQNALFAILWALLPGGVVAYLAHIQSVWATPALEGLGASAMAIVVALAIKANSHLPQKRIMPNTENIEACVRQWLNNFNFGIKNSPVSTAYFRVLATMDSGTKMLVGRGKGDGVSNYVMVRTDIAPSTEENEFITGLSLGDQELLILQIRLELARRNIGYSGLEFPIHDFHIFKRVPINSSLIEHDFVKALDEVESAVHSVSIVYRIGKQRFTGAHTGEPKQSIPQ